ncbi:uncharacterized protein BP5553_10695 [Venustampulla echinocandica]|uniref:beta-mannosidase n=1 Tax=Venustampulla echinocandica TaxID=2656787 RepID=A0A370T8M5_9HELO|nr:uncharacterized protein BP5553_10695 [Venustampulla echinocandica]RDL29715.1 hypothetical protein BP5553_10695 [Venustampulla echinocandica]
MSKTQILLSSNWECKLSNPDRCKSIPADSSLTSWSPAYHFPSVIHLELLTTSKIPDPNIGENERLVQWVGECDWEYRCRFPTPGMKYSREESKVMEMVFEGLDTFATVMLNGTVILKNEDMFLPQRVDVKHILNPARETLQNEMTILFESALKKGTELEIKHGVKESLMRDPRRMYVRKAQVDLHVTTTLAEDHASAEICVVTNLSTSLQSGMRLEVGIVDTVGKIVAKHQLEMRHSSTSECKISIQNPNPGWPNGLGLQSLYTANVTLLNTTNSQTLDNKSTKFGIRTIALIQRPLASAPGTTFLFSINNHSTFIQGANWVPADNFLPRLTRSRYFSILRMAKRANLNMIRVWGGGIYESEDFFDACDELGLLVWHDYAFACGDFPVHEGFLENVRKEVRAQTVRVRNRASLAVICGGNEDFMLADEDGEALPGLWMKKKHYDHTDTVGPFEDTDFPQRKIYLDIIPKMVEELCPDIQYWPNSPWGGKEKANDPTVGDIHQWDVWHGKSRSYQDYASLSGRLVSEFGMHGFPDMRTINHFAPDQRDRHPQSKVIDCHNKGHGSETRIVRYLAENFRYSMDLEVFAYVSQLMQSEALGYALSGWKRLFGGKGMEECAGLIIWQLNDVYPCTSWSIIDYFLRPKPSFYTIRRCFLPYSIGIQRSPPSRWVDDDRPRDTYIPSFDIFAHNSTVKEVKFVLRIRAYDMFTREYLDYPQENQEVLLGANRNTELGRIENPGSVTEDSLIVLCASLLDPHYGAGGG